MSFDLEIVTDLKPELSQVEEFFFSRNRFAVEGKLNGDAGNVLIARKSKDKAHPCFTIDGPFQIEIEDLEEEVSAHVLDPHWLVQISVPAAAFEADRKIAKELARHIANTNRGSVYDPQSEKVIWPKQSYRHYVTTTQEERIRLVGLDWFLPASRGSTDTAKTLLVSLRKLCPEGLPTRFGTFEPLQHRLDADDESFLKMWEEVSEVEYGDSFFWNAKRPCFEGSVFFPDKRDKFKPSRAERSIHLSMDFDGRALHAHAGWCETIVRLFVELARALGSFYAIGYVQRNVIARRGIWFDGESEPSPTLRGRWWLGLPPNPVWLMWFGGGYARRLESLKADASTVTAEGMLFRQGSLPMDRDELIGTFPDLPAMLFAQIEDDEYLPAQEIPDLE